MFKVSFKETANNPSKVVCKAGLMTQVILKGSVKLPAFFHQIPVAITEWISKQNRVEVYENVANNTIIIYSSGTAKCMEDDKYNTILGERIAESRAKYTIYKFFYDLCKKLYYYYVSLLFGKEGVVGIGSPDSLEREIHKYCILCKREKDHEQELINSNKHE